MNEQQLQAIKEEYNNMDWEEFRENAGDLTQREIDIYDTVVIEGLPTLIVEVEKLHDTFNEIKLDILSVSEMINVAMMYDENIDLSLLNDKLHQIYLRLDGE